MPGNRREGKCISHPFSVWGSVCLVPLVGPVLSGNYVKSVQFFTIYTGQFERHFLL